MAHKVGKGFTGMKHAIESKEKMSMSLKKRYTKFKHPRVGKSHSEEGKLKISMANKGRKDSIETRNRKSLARMGSKNPMFGKCCSDEKKEKISLGNKGHKYDGKICPKCGTAHLDRTGENNPMFGRSGIKNPFYGKHHTEETLDKVRGDNNSSKRPEVKIKMRLSAIRRIEKQFNNGETLIPAVGNYETQILDNLEQCFGYPIERQHKVAGYFLDGYCKMLRLAIEIDEPAHKSKIKKDAFRQKEIEKELGCKFLRINI